MTDEAFIGSLGMSPLRLTSEIGTWIAMVCTLSPCSPLTPVALGSGIRCRFWKGRRAPRSKTLPEVDVEGIAALTGEDGAAAPDRVDRRRREAAP